jgi:hypothetical protein
MPNRSGENPKEEEEVEYEHFKCAPNDALSSPYAKETNAKLRAQNALQNRMCKRNSK